MNIYLGDHFETMIREQVASGRYANASEVVREALRRYEDEETRITRLRELVQKADDDIAAGREIIIEDTNAYAVKVRKQTRARVNEAESGGLDRAAS
jgi:antitoxin ParD1/3/4